MWWIVREGRAKPRERDRPRRRGSLNSSFRTISITAAASHASYCSASSTRIDTSLSLLYAFSRKNWLAGQVHHLRQSSRTRKHAATPAALVPARHQGNDKRRTQLSITCSPHYALSRSKQASHAPRHRARVLWLLPALLQPGTDHERALRTLASSSVSSQAIGGAMQCCNS